MPAPVNAGDFWILADEGAVNACLAVDFAVCPLPEIDLGIDSYQLHGGVQYVAPNRFWMMGGEFSIGEKPRVVRTDRERIKVVEYDYTGSERSTIIDYPQQLVPTRVERGTSHVHGDVRMYQTKGATGDEFGDPVPPVYFYNYRDNPINSGLYYLMEDIDGVSGPVSNVQAGPMLLHNEKLFGLAASIGDGQWRVCRYAIPVGGPGDLPDPTGREMPVEQAATDALLSDVGFDAVLILSDDNRMFVFNNTSKTLVEFDDAMTSQDNWSLPVGQTRVSFNGAMSPIPIAANRISFPALQTTPRQLYELTPGGAPVVVHEWTSLDMQPYDLNPGMQALVGDDGLVWTHFKFGQGAPAYVALLNFKGTPDYP